MEARVFLVLALLLQAAAARECSGPGDVPYGSCTECLRQAEAGCVWCLDDHQSYKGLAK